MRFLLFVVIAATIGCSAPGPATPAAPSPPAPSLPAPALTAQDDLTATPRADGGFDLQGTAVNRGSGCGTAVTGTTTLTAKQSAATLQFPWALPASQVIRPLEQFTYPIGSLTRQQAIDFDEGTYWTSFASTTVACSPKTMAR